MPLLLPFLWILRGIAVLQEKLGIAERLSDDWRVPGEKWSREFSETALRTFRQEGPNWKPLAESTVRQRIALGYGGRHPILQRTQRLMESMTNEFHPEAVRHIEGRRWERGTRVPYAAKQHATRPFIPMGTEEDKLLNEAGKLVLRHVAKPLEQ